MANKMPDSIEKREKEKYQNAWNFLYKAASQCALPLVKYISKASDINWKLLDIGCGNGITVNGLKNKGFNCKGIDITLDGIKGDKKDFIEAPIWNMPFKDNEFDFTFSTDVLEHLPTNMIDKSIKEIYRVTKTKTFHCIALFPAKRGKIILHLTVKPIKWWEEKLIGLNVKNLNLEIIGRKSFLKKYI